MIEVSSKLAFSQKLEDTIQDVEFAIVMEAEKRVFGDARQVSRAQRITILKDALQVAGRKRIEKHFEFPRRALPPAQAGEVIFRIGPAKMFSRSLEWIVKEVESAIFLVACAKFKGNKAEVVRALRVGRERINKPAGKGRASHFAEAQDELRRAGWIR